MTEIEAKAMLAKLSEHYGEPVLPLERFCYALTTWSRLSENKLPLLQIKKSNLLFRMIYLGEEPRAVQCPEHLGKWSGCKPPGACVCQTAGNVTGWLPNSEKS